MYKKSVYGMTLIELMITVAIIGILASIAYPSYTEFVVRSNRSEAQRELMRIANMQEQYYVDNRTYTNNMTLLGESADPFITESGNYSIDVKESTVTNSFTLQAKALGTQAANDPNCKLLEINELGKKSPSPSTSTCWEN